MYTYDKKILFSDIDANSKMSFYSLMNSIQDCINVNSESIGRGIDYMLEHGRTWFAVGWNIEIKRMPTIFEEITLKTWPYDFGTTLGYRNVIVTDSKGEDIICADSLWALMDVAEGRPTKITEEDAKGYDLEPAYPMEPMQRKIKIPKETTVVGELEVKKSNIDYNGHMSNGEYVKIAYDYLQGDVNVSRMRVEYKSQAKLGEKISVRAYTEDKTHGYVITGETERDVKAVVCFTCE